MVLVEDPSENFQRVRDFLDCKRCLQLAECAKILREKDRKVTTKDDDGDEGAPPSAKRRRRSVAAASTSKPDGDTSAPADRFVAAAKKQLKISRNQSRRVYQILRYFLLPRDKPTAVEAYRSALLERTRIMNSVSITGVFRLSFEDGLVKFRPRLSKA